MKLLHIDYVFVRTGRKGNTLDLQTPSGPKQVTFGNPVKHGSGNDGEVHKVDGDPTSVVKVFKNHPLDHPTVQNEINNLKATGQYHGHGEVDGKAAIAMQKAQGKPLRETAAYAKTRGDKFSEAHEATLNRATELAEKAALDHAAKTGVMHKYVLLRESNDCFISPEPLAICTVGTSDLRRKKMASWTKPTS
jgi:hypothetical protein